MIDDRREVDPAVVRRLIASQFPAWADLPLARGPEAGWDNRTFRLGADMKVRLPSAARYAAQPGKEHRWLPRLAPRLPLAIPEPLALGRPSTEFPWPWSVQRWRPGRSALPARIADRRRFARDLATFLNALQTIPPMGGPPAGSHSFFRGGALATYDAATRSGLAALASPGEAAAARAIWETALAAPWRGPPVWVHGDVAPGNLIVAQGRLAAVIDFGCCAVGDPACDLAIAWTSFDAGVRATFRDAVAADAALWARAAGWALWKALADLAAGAPPRRGEAPPRRVLAALLANGGSAPT